METPNDWFVKQQVARKLATLILDCDGVLYSQWFKGKDNVVTDSLSRELYYLNVKSHESFLKNTVPNQLPQNFHLQTVPEEISSFISSMLQQLPVKTLRLKQQKPSELALGNGGVLSSLGVVLPSRATLITSTHSKRMLFCQHSPRPSEKVPSLQEVVNLWWQTQLVPPSHLWHRPLGQTTGLTQDWTTTVRHAFC